MAGVLGRLSSVHTLWYLIIFAHLPVVGIEHFNRLTNFTWLVWVSAGISIWKSSYKTGKKLCRSLMHVQWSFLFLNRDLAGYSSHPVLYQPLLLIFACRAAHKHMPYTQAPRIWHEFQIAISFFNVAMHLTWIYGRNVLKFRWLIVFLNRIKVPGTTTAQRARETNNNSSAIIHRS